LEVGLDELFSFGQTRIDRSDPFSMTILALRMSRHSNGVSKLHGDVSRSLWKDVWNGVPAPEVPITHVTNGIHTKTWMAPELAALYQKYLGDWEEHITEPEFWRGVIDIPDAQLWETHQQLKHRLGDLARPPSTTRRLAGIGPQREPNSRSGCLDDRFRAAIRDLQTRRAFVQRQGAIEAFAQRHHAPGAIHFRRQSSSARRRRTRAHPGSLQIQPRSRLRKSRRVSGRLRQLHRASLGAGCRSLVEHSAPTDGSERYQRNEMLPEWRN